MKENGNSLIKTFEKYENDKKKRIEYLDIARGIAIILMVIGHVIGKNMARNLIFSFHMPLFIIVSGMFFREKKIKDIIVNTIKKLILPYIVSIFIVDIFKYVIIEKNNFTDVIINYLKQIMLSYSHMKNDIEIDSIGVLWFMPFLAIIRMGFYTLKRMTKENDNLLGICCLLFSYVGYLIGIKGYWLPFSIDVALACLIFYYLGYFLIKKDLLNKIMNDKAILLIFFVIWIITVKFGSIEIAVREYPNGFFTYIGAICGSILLMKASMFINNKLNFIGKILSWFGKNSMYVLICHYAEINLIKYDGIISVLHNKVVKKMILSLIKITIISIGTSIILLSKKGINRIKILTK